MADASQQTNHTCPACNKPVDPLRSPAVSVVDGRITHFCSRDCRERHLKRKKAQPTPQKPKDSPDPTGDIAITRDPFPITSGEQTAFLQSKLLKPQMLITALYLLLTGVVIFLPPLFNNLLPPLVVAALVVIRTLITLIRDRQSNALRRLDGLAPTISSLAVLSGVFFGAPSKLTAVMMALLLTTESIGRLFELIGRHRSGVLSAVDDNQTVSLPESWRDNSAFAEKTKRFAMVLEWIRYPAAVSVGLLTHFVTAQSIPDTLLAFATALLAIHPRTIRMATGDAHLAAALMASKLNVAVRDAHAVDALAKTHTALFMDRNTLLSREIRVVDWTALPEANEQSVLDALLTLQSNATGPIAEAVASFSAEKKARVSGTCEVTRKPGRGVVGKTPWGIVVSGSRQLLLDEQITTGLLEEAAKKIEESGRRAVFLAIDGRATAVFGLEQSFVKGAEKTVSSLRRLGMETAMTTSAEVRAADALCHRLGLDVCYFEAGEEKLESALISIDGRGDNAVLIGSGNAFEEHLRSATAAIAFNNIERTQAGFDTKSDDITLLPKLVRMARRANLSATVNLILALGAMLFSLGISVSWFSASIVLLAGILNAAVAAGATFNAPYPMAMRLLHQIAAPFRWLYGLASRLRHSRT